jgi:hypothetical protein
MLVYTVDTDVPLGQTLAQGLVHRAPSAGAFSALASTLACHQHRLVTANECIDL